MGVSISMMGGAVRGTSVRSRVAGITIMGVVGGDDAYDYGYDDGYEDGYYD